ncbi:MAG: DMT family transporter [Limnobacter sp.]|nr:DMT family transporter [Limnobacter sp.]
MTLASYIRLLLLAMIWGSSFLFQRIAVPELGPHWVAAGRLMLGGLVLVLVMLAMRKPLYLRKHAGAYIWIGFINSALPFWLFAYASITLPAGVTAVLNAMVPLFTVLLLWMQGNKPSAGKFAGVSLGIIGVGHDRRFWRLAHESGNGIGRVGGYGRRCSLCIQCQRNSQTLFRCGSPGRGHRQFVGCHTRIAAAAVY